MRVCSFLDYNLLMILLCLVRMLRGWNKDGVGKMVFKMGDEG